MSTQEQLALAEATPVTATEPIASARPASLWRDTLGSVLRQRSARVGLLMLTFLVLVAIFAPVIATHDPYQSLLGVEPGVVKRSGPCIHILGCPASQPEHIFGTDGNFRDLYSRVVYGARTSLTEASRPSRSRSSSARSSARSRATWAARATTC